MSKSKRILIVADLSSNPIKMFLHHARKLAKGFIRLGHDVNTFSYRSELLQLSPLKNPSFAGCFFKSKVDELLANGIRNYSPDIIHVSFAKFLDVKTIALMQQAAPNAFLIGIDVDLWPELHKNKVQTAEKLDVVLTTYGDNGQQAFRHGGVRCVFMPNMCDPDVEHRHEVSDGWKSDILFTGKIKHKHYPTEDIRSELVGRLVRMKNCAVYGCCGRPNVGGINYLYAISGANIGLSVNAVNDVRLYHSDRTTQYMACGTLVLAKRVPDTDLLFQDKVHLRYFDTAEEFFDLANWYLTHQDERIKIANAGMEHAHAEFNCQKIAKYILDLIETGRYSAPWMR